MIREVNVIRLILPSKLTSLKLFHTKPHKETQCCQQSLSRVFFFFLKYFHEQRFLGQSLVFYEQNDFLMCVIYIKRTSFEDLVSWQSQIAGRLSGNISPSSLPVFQIHLFMQLLSSQWLGSKGIHLTKRWTVQQILWRPPRSLFRMERNDYLSVWGYWVLTSHS